MPDYNVPVPRYWRNIPTYYRLTVSRCRSCGRVYYPPRARCVCGSRDIEQVSLLDACRKFRLAEFTVLHSVSVDFEKQKPLIFGLVKCENPEVSLVSPITDVLNVGDLQSGIELEPVFRVVKRDGSYGIVCYGTKFRIATREVKV